MNRKQKQLKADLHKWSEDKPPLISFLAILTAYTSEPTHQLFEWIADGSIEKVPFGQYDHDRFYLYYTDRRPMICDMVRALGCSNAEVQEILYFENLSRQPKEWWSKSLDGITIGKFREISNKIHDLSQDCLNEFIESLVLDKDDLEDSQMEIFIKEPVARFFLLIYYPCWVRTGYYPQQLFERVVGTDKPDYKAFEDLLRVDPEFVHHPSIRQYLHSCRTNTRKRLYASIRKVLGKNPRKLTRKQVKRKFAGLIYKQTRNLRLVEPKFKQITNLYHLLARLEHPLRKTHRTRDLEMQHDESTTVAIQRASKQWHFMPELDDNFFESVQRILKPAA